jgi:2-oxoglutarate ferredoxin oxidoreductase subunit alpha
MQEVTIGIGGAAGDGLDKSGDTLAKTAGRLGLHVFAYNSYQSVIRGGHIWLRVRIGQDKVYSHGDNLTALIGLNQDTIERHTPEVDPGGVIVFNSDRLKCDASRAKPGVNVMPLPMKEITAEVSKVHGPIQPIMQNTVALGAVLYMLNIGLEETANVLSETFSHKGQAVIDLNIGLLQAGYEYAKQHAKPVANTDKWKFTNVRRPFITGNEAIAIAAVAAGCKFYSAYPMTPASTILHWMANHAGKVGVCVKQAEDELAVINMAIGAGIAGVRSMCGTAGGGFALMTEAIGMAGMMEIPVVCVEVQRGGPSTGLPTKTEQADLWQVVGASQGEFPKMIVCPTDVVDAYWSTVEAFNCAEKYQLPVMIMSDLLLSEHPETIDADSIRADVPIERGEIVTSWDEEKQGRYKRFKMTPNGVSPRALPGTAQTLYVSPSDDHDEESILISDVFTSSPMRRKMHEKRMRKLDYLLKELPAPKLEGPADADLTLVGWGSSQGVIREAMAILNAQGVKTNMLQVKYIYPFHTKEVTEILSKAKKKFSVEGNFTSMFSKYLRSETGIAMDAHVNRYDGEPFEPMYIVNEVKALLAGTKKDLDVTEDEAREMASHYLRTHLGDRFRPSNVVKESANGQGEPIWKVEIVERISGKKEGEVKIGAKTGSTYSYTTATAPQPVS